MTLSLFGWIVATLSVVGVVLNIYKSRWCFYIWTLTNFSWMMIDYNAGITSQSALNALYFLLAIWGIIKWREK
tara:strand:- start:1025 stop:1243 length:219 start_codon:yes stop_codon:yes gene_type:complete